MNKTLAHIVIVLAFPVLLFNAHWTKTAAFAPEQGGGVIDVSGTNLAGVTWDHATGLLQMYSARGGYQASNGQIVVPGMLAYERPGG